MQRQFKTLISIAIVLTALLTFACSSKSGDRPEPASSEIEFLADPKTNTNIGLRLDDNSPEGTLAYDIVLNYEWEVSDGVLYWDRARWEETHGYLQDYIPEGEWTTKMQLSQGHRAVWLLPAGPGEYWVRVRNLTLGNHEWLVTRHLVIEQDNR